MGEIGKTRAEKRNLSQHALAAGLRELRRRRRAAAAAAAGRRPTRLF
jgi:hypothetical protein